MIQNAVSLIEKELKEKGTKERKRICISFFKTGKGQYGEGDMFLGVTVPDTRKIVKKYTKDLSLEDVLVLLNNKYHEVRLSALLCLVLKMDEAYKINDLKQQKKIFDVYIKNSHKINNWDLVDVSCHYIVGRFLFDKDRSILYKLAKKDDLWSRRIAIVSTFYFIKRGDYGDTFSLCEILINDKEDLMHKACGWMLREIGKSSGIETLNIFLKKHISKLPRTTLRYAIERHSPLLRAKILNGIFE